MNETCVCCGEIIPEGHQVCRKCMRLASVDVVPAQIVERAGTRFLSKEDVLRGFLGSQVANRCNYTSTGVKTAKTY